MSRTVPEAWIEKLFTRMASLWGGRFADMWRDCDLDEVKATWRAGLANVTDEGLKRGVAALFHEKAPPTLPRFRELCAPVPAMYRPPAASLTDATGRTAPDEARARLASIADAVTSAMQTTAADPLAWARRIIARYERGESVTSRQLQHARDAIAGWEVTHGTAHALAEVELPARIPSPHIEGDTPPREPGCDDDLEVA